MAIFDEWFVLGPGSGYKFEAITGIGQASSIRDI